MTKTNTKTADKMKLSFVIKTLSRSIREYKVASILTPLFVMIEVVIECLIPWLMTLLLGAIEYVSGCASAPDPLVIKIVNFITGGNLEGQVVSVIIWFGLVLILLALLSLLCGTLSGLFCATASSGFSKNLRRDMYSKIQGFSFSNIDKFSTSSLVTRLTTDVTNVEMAYMMIIRTAIRSPFMLVFAITMSFTINSKMACIFLFTAPFLAIGLTLIMIKAIPFFNRIFKKYDKLNESVEENIRGMRVVKSYCRETQEIEKFDKASTSVKDDFTKAEKIVALNGPLMSFCVYAGITAIYIIGSMLIINSKNQLLKWTELQSFMTYSFQMLMSLMMFSMIMVMVLISVASAKRICEVLNEQSSIISPSNPVNEVKDGSIDFENVNFKYFKDADKSALENINISIKSGETIGIIGATGSGKTSLVQLIPRLYDVTDGSVKVGGVNVKDYNLEALRNSVAMVLQKNVLFSGTIKENMRWGDQNATDEDIIGACKLAQADEFICSFPKKYDTYIEQGGVNVSGGQKQRLCIARALLKKPKILILDDSTSAVDTKTDALIRKSFKEFIPKTTKIIIAQRIASVEEADKIIILDCGKIADIGNHNELLARNTIYQELYYSQNKENKKEAK